MRNLVPSATRAPVASHRACRWLLAAALVATSAAAAEDLPPLPIEVPGEAWRSLYTAVDAEFEASLAASLDSRWAGLVRRKKLAVGLVDLRDPVNPRFARVNGQTMMYAASLPKIAILLAAYVSFEDGSLEETAAVHERLGAMIRTSSNSAATEMIDALGYEKIEQVVTGPPYRLYDPARGGGLWVGKRFAKEGRRYPDPLRGISHGATVTQVCRFYWMLATGRVISPERSRQMLEDLGDPGLQHKFVGELTHRAPRARFFRKSGSWQIWHSDSILVWGPQRRYILVAMVESPDGEAIVRQVVGVAEAALESVASAAATPRGR